MFKRNNQIMTNVGDILSMAGNLFIRNISWFWASNIKWATTWQNQHKMSVHPAKTKISLGIRPVWSVFAVHSMGSWGLKVSSCGQRRLIRLVRCPGWPESSLDPQPFCWFCHVTAQLCYQITKMQKLRATKVNRFTVSQYGHMDDGCMV